MHPDDPEHYREAAQELSQWLQRHAADGVPELVLIDLLRTTADSVEQRGYVSRRKAP